MSKPVRPRLACRPCTRKKIRCDKLTPCDNCVKRGHPELCFRDPVSNADVGQSQEAMVGRAPASTAHEASDGLMQLMQSLVSRIDQIEARQQQHQAPQLQVQPSEVGYGVDGGAGPAPGIGLAGLTPLGTTQPYIQAAGSLHALRAVLAEENGLGKIAEHQRVILQRLVPDASCAEQLVQYHTESLLWSHGGYHTPTLKQEVSRFYSIQNGQVPDTEDGNFQWLALFFALISGSIISASSPLAEKWGFQKEEQSLLSAKWHEAAIECLHISRYLTDHNIHTLQTIVVLNTSAYMLGRMQCQNVLNATGIRIAQNMGLHRFGSETDGLSDGLVYRETCRRVWYALLRQDYFFIPFSDCYQVRPVFNQTMPPRNCRDEEMVSLPDYMPTITSYCSFLDKIAALMPEIHDAFSACTTVYARYEEVIRFDSKMRALATVHRPYFFTDSPVDPAWPNYIPWARSCLTISFARKVIMIHRKMLARSMTDPIFSFTRRTCVAASKTILKTIRQPHSEERPIMWTEQAFGVTAGVILCFDMLYRSPLDSESAQQQHRALIEEGIENLRQIKQSIIAQKGVRLLSALLRENTGRAVTSRHKRRFDDMEAGNASHENLPPLIDVETFVRDFWKRKGDNKGDRDAPNYESPASTQPPLPGTGDVSPFGSDDVGWAIDYGLYWPIQSVNLGEGIGDTLNGRGLYWPLPSLTQGDEDMDAQDVSNGMRDKIPTFEDLLFRAENFDF